MSDCEEVFENDALYLEERLNCEFALLQESDRATLIEYAERFIYLQVRIELLTNRLSSNDKYVINEYYNNPAETQAKDEPEEFIAKLADLVKVAKQHSELLRADKISMKKLARDDPGAYAKALSYRRMSAKEGKPLGKFTENILSSYISGDNRRFDQDHTQWFVLCESGQLDKQDARVSIPLNQLTIDGHFSK